MPATRTAMLPGRARGPTWRPAPRVLLRAPIGGGVLGGGARPLIRQRRWLGDTRGGGGGRGGGKLVTSTFSFRRGQKVSFVIVNSSDFPGQFTVSSRHGIFGVRPPGGAAGHGASTVEPGGRGGGGGARGGGPAGRAAGLLGDAGGRASGRRAALAGDGVGAGAYVHAGVDAEWIGLADYFQHCAPGFSRRRRRRCGRGRVARAAPARPGACLSDRRVRPLCALAPTAAAHPSGKQSLHQGQRSSSQGGGPVSVPAWLRSWFSAASLRGGASRERGDSPTPRS